MPSNRPSDILETDQKKRGRGRPRLPNALTPAQRAKRYRDNKRARQAAGGAATEIRQEKSPEAAVPSADTINQLLTEKARLRLALDASRSRINDLTGALEFFVTAHAKNKRISADQMKGLHALLALDNPADDVVLRHKKKR